jgi:hypothetical protein
MEVIVSIDYNHISQADREELAALADGIKRLCSYHGKRMNKKGEANLLTLAVFNLGVAIHNFTSLNGTMKIWASFTPCLFEGDDHVEPTTISE